jgi:hypothetical protein
MIKIHNKYLLFFILIVFLISAVWMGLFVFQEYKQDLRHQLFCLDIYTGMQKSEVKNILAKYGSYSWRDDYVLKEWTYVYFDKFWVRTVLGHPIVLKFDNKNKLIAISGREKLGDEFQVDCTK